MSKLDINTLLAASLQNRGDGNNEQQAINESFNLNLESVAQQEYVEQYLGEDSIANMRAAIASGIAVHTVLEARYNSRGSE